MSKEKFTQGEWVAFYPHELTSSGYVLVETADGNRIYTDECHESTIVERKSNARLIAAAPDMYRALEGLLKAYEAVCDIRADGSWHSHALKALAKARGEK